MNLTNGTTTTAEPGWSPTPAINPVPVPAVNPIQYQDQCAYQTQCGDHDHTVKSAEDSPTPFYTTTDYLSSTSPTSSTSSSEAPTPEWALALSPTLISSLASSVRRNLESAANAVDAKGDGDAEHRTLYACTTSPHFQLGAYNIIWTITFLADGTQWVLRIPTCPPSPALARRLHSDLLAVRLIRRHTTIPIPQVFAYNFATVDNVLDRPYVLMAKARGTQLCKLWFDSSWFTDERRKRVFGSLVENMVQLKTLEFDRIGDLVEDEEGKVVVGPMGSSLDELSVAATSEPSPSAGGEKQARTPSTQLTPSLGPYTTAHSYLLSQINQKLLSLPPPLPSTEPCEDRVTLAMLRLFAGSIPNPQFDGPPFVLGKPDFDFQNVFVDERTGEVTDLIDWDECRTRPRELGYATYPAWITRDWDPSLYAYYIPAELGSYEASAAQLREQQEEDSPDTLQNFRAEYLATVAELDPHSARMTEQSHVVGAISAATSKDFLRGNVVAKLKEYVFGQHRMDFANRLDEAIMTGQWIQTLPRATNLSSS